MQATISTVDGLAVGNHNVDFSISIGSNGIPRTTSISFEITPACKYSEISSSHSYFPISVVIESAYELEVDPNKYTHRYKADWDSLGYPGVCTISWTLAGEGTAFVSITGTTIKVSPERLEDLVGYYDLSLVSYYSASTYEPTLPTNTNIY